MFNKEYLEILSKGSESWNEYRLKKKETAFPDLRNGFFVKQNLTKIDLRKSILYDTNFCGANLTNGDLSESQIINGDFANTVLDNSNLIGIDVHESNFNNSSLIQANLMYSNFIKVKLIEANFSNSDLSYANFTDSDLSNSDLTDVDLFNAYLCNTNLKNVNLSGVNLDNADLKNANLEGSKGLTLKQLTKAKNWTKAKYSRDLQKNTLFQFLFFLEELRISLEELKGIKYFAKKILIILSFILLLYIWFIVTIK